MTGEEQLEFLQKLKALGVREFVFDFNSGLLSRGSFFPPEPERLERAKPDPLDNKVNDATGLTRTESRELFGMDE